METAKLLIDGYFDHRTADNYHLTVDDLLDFPKEDEVMNDAFFVGNSSNSSPFAVHSSSMSGSGSDPQFSGNFTSRSCSNSHFSSELCIPYDDLGDLDWIPNFSTDDFHNLGLITGADTSSSETEQSATAHASVIGSYVSVPTKSRSKLSRAAPREWSSRIRVFSPASSTIPAVATTKKETGVAAQGRKCLHCGSEKTPQWRAGPMGPKTLCNACGVRYNSGRLVPEYRPAASPTFQPEKHSNSHRKVVEIRRQTEERTYQRRQ